MTCKRDLRVRDRDTWFCVRDETETRPSQISSRPRRDRDIGNMVRDETETETLSDRDRDLLRDLIVYDALGHMC